MSGPVDLGNDGWRVLKWPCRCGIMHKDKGYCPKCKETRQDYMENETPKNESETISQLVNKLLKEHQDSCKTEHCHLCWRGDPKQW